jgi:hypothetical protein
MAKTTKPTKQQVAQAKARAGGNNPVKVTNAGLKKLGGAALIAASMTPAGRAVKTATTAVKVATKVSSAARANTRALKAANKDVAIKYKKGYNESNYSGRNESKPKQVAKNKSRANNPKAPMTSPSSYKESKSAYNAWAKKNPEVAKANPPSGKFGPNISRSEKVNKKLSQLNRRSAAVASKKKYSDMTPAEKRKYDSLNAEITNRISKPK